jgi:PAS domain S-box-containing protein
MPDRSPLRELDIHALLDSAPDGVFVADVHGRYIYVNQAGCRMLGMERDELLGKTVFDLIPEGDGVRLQASKRAMLAGRDQAEEWVLRHKDGHWVPVEVNANILPNGQWQAFVRDIGDRKRLEQQAHSSERALAGIIDLLPVGVWITDRDGTITRGNEAGRRIWGGARHVGPENYGVYKGWWTESGEPIAADEWALARALSKGETSVGELVRIQCFDGSFKTIINSAMPLRDTRGDISGAICVNEDITTLFDAQQRLQQSETLFRTVFELLPVGLYLTDAQGHITHGNPAGHRIWQGLRHVGPEEFGEYKAWWADSGEPVEADDWAVVRAVRRGQTSRSELIRIQCFDGTFKTVLNWAAPIRGKGGEVAGAVAVNQDVTALVRTQEQLRAAVRDREHILGVVAHDLRNPLSSIAVQAALLGRKAASMPQAQACTAAADAIADASRRMAGLVDDLLAISVAGTGGSMLRLEPVRAAELLSLAAQQAAPLVNDAGLQLELQQDGELPAIHVDANRIMRVFGNLLDNAIKFTEAGGRVILRAEPAPGAVLFSIANSGPAVPQPDLERLFQPFWQASGEDRGGAGLGLSICRSIIEAHGGTVWAEPMPGMRLRILFLLPRGLPQAELAVPPESEPAQAPSDGVSPSSAGPNAPTLNLH